MKTALRRATRNGADPESVASVAERAGRSPRTVYRILDYDDRQLIQLDLADRLLLAAGGHLSLDCMDEEDIDDG